MSTAKENSKKIRREVKKHAQAIHNKVAQEVVTGLYMLDLWERAKWSWKILRGLRKKESAASKVRSIVRRVSISISHAAKRLWRAVRRG